jgi:cell surface protein SprA
MVSIQNTNQRIYSHRVGEIGDFRNIQFVRMFLTNFEDNVTVRMVDLSFVRNQWRKYTGSIQAPTDFIPRDNGETEFFDVGAVSLEENAKKTPVSYVTPPGMVREVGLNASSNPIQLNEQSLRLSFCNLKMAMLRLVLKISILISDSIKKSECLLMRKITMP